MSETKRVALTTLSTNKCDKKSGKNFGKTVRLDIPLIEPNEHLCSVFNYTKLLNAAEKKRLKKKQQQTDDKVNGAVVPFDDEDDEDVKRIARQFEEKYGASDRRKQNRCQTYSELGAGYDENDSFIDNTDACDEALPEEMQTVHGGYYVNSGPLEFKRVESEADDLDDIKGKKRKFGPNVIRDDTESEDEEDDDDDEDDDDEDEEDDDEEDEEEIEEEVNGKENGETEKVEDKVKDDKNLDDVNSSQPVVVKKMKVAEKSEEKQDIAIVTKLDPTALNHEDTASLKKKRKKRTLTVAERQHLFEQQLAKETVNSSVTVPTVPVQSVSNVNSNNDNKNSNLVTAANDSTTNVTVTNGKSSVNNNPVTGTTLLSSNSVISNANHSNNNSNASSRTNSPTNTLATPPHQSGSFGNLVKHSSKKKTLTVKALLEEKRGSNPNEISNLQTSVSNNIVPVTSSTASNTAATATAVTTAASGSAGNPVTPVEVKKGVNEHTSVNDVIEYVISSAVDGESSKDSSSSTSKSQTGLAVCTDSDLSTESSDSQLNKLAHPANLSATKSAASNIEIPPVPDNLSSDIVDLINGIKVSNSLADNTSRRYFPEDINNMLLSLEKKSQMLSSAHKNIIYEHLACFLPCSKFTLVKRVKKLYFDSVEEEMNEPIRKLKTTIDTVMPSLLEKYSKDCQNVAAEKSNNEPPSTDVSSEAVIKSDVGGKIPRRKFVWSSESRQYVREIIEKRNQCYLIKNPRRESAETYLTSFLSSKILPLWPPGWMKITTLRREAGEVVSGRNKKKTTPAHSPPQLSSQIGHSQSPQHSQAHSQQQQISNRQKSPIQSLLNVSLPSSTTLTPAVVTSSSLSSYNSKMQDSGNLNPLKRNSVMVSPNQISVSVSSPSNINLLGMRTPSDSSSSIGVLPRVTTSSTTHQSSSSKTQKSNPSTPSPPKKQCVFPNNNLNNVSLKPNTIEPQNNSKEQFPLYDLVKSQSSNSFKINETEIEVLTSKDNGNHDTPPKLSLHKSDKKFSNRKFDISANNSSSSMSLISNTKEISNHAKQDRDRHNLQTALMASDLSPNSSVGSNHKSNKNHDKSNMEPVNNNGHSKKKKLISDMESKSKSNTITLNGSAVSFTPSSLAAGSTSAINTSSSKVKRELKTEDVNVSVGNPSNKETINMENILDLSSSNCGSLRPDNNGNSCVINKSNINNSKSVIKNVSSVNERTTSSASNNNSCGGVYTSEPRKSIISGTLSPGLQDIFAASNNKDQKSATSVSPASKTSNTMPSNNNPKPQNQSTPVRSLKQRILQDQQISVSVASENNTKRSPDDKTNIKTNMPSGNSGNSYDVKKKNKTESSSAINKQSEVIQTSQPDDVSDQQQVTATSENPDKVRRNSTGSRQQRLPSGDQEAKMQMEVDQVIQDLAMLRQMSGCGSSANNSDDVSPHKGMSGHKTMSSSPFISSSSCSSTSSFSMSGEVKKSGQSVSSYQNEFYKHLMQKEPVSPPPLSTSPVYSKHDNVSRHHGFQNSPYPSDNLLDDIPSKYSSISLHPVSVQSKQNSSKQSQLNQQSSSNISQSLPNLSPGVIQHHSSTHHQSQSSHYQQKFHNNRHLQSVLPHRDNKNEDYQSVVKKSSPQPFNRFDWSFAGSSHHQSSPQ